MASRNFDPLDLFLQMAESELRHDAHLAARAVRFQPSVDMYETSTALVIKIELPGIRLDQLSIVLSADDRRLYVSGERRERHEANCVRTYHLETYYGPFEREISLPASVRFDRNKITASYRDGMLSIGLPKRTEVTETHVIAIITEE